MKLTAILLAAFLLILGMTWLTWITVDAKALGALAFVTGILIVLEWAYPFARRVS